MFALTSFASGFVLFQLAVDSGSDEFLVLFLPASFVCLGGGIGLVGYSQFGWRGAAIAFGLYAVLFFVAAIVVMRIINEALEGA